MRAWVSGMKYPSSVAITGVLASLFFGNGRIWSRAGGSSPTRTPATLTVDGKEVANGKVARTIPFRVSADETLDIGEDTGTPVSDDYHVPFKFTGTLNKVVVDLGEAKLGSDEQKELDEQEGTNEVID